MLHGTPLRYPGGKQRLAPFIAEIIEANDLEGGDYCEPYCGGAGVAIALLLSRKVRRIYLNDRCKPLVAFWRSVLDKPEALCRRISSASLTVQEWERQREVFRREGEFSDLDLGFSMFFLNRCNRSGILRGGIIGGKDQSGRWKIDARFNRKELIRRIEAIALFRDRISVFNMDAEEFIVGTVPGFGERMLVYCDPPYFEKAERLYLNTYQPQDHVRISRVIQRKLRKPWIVSYDNCKPIAEAYGRCRSFCYDLQYNARTVYKGSEMFFLSDGLELPRSSSVPCIDKVIQNKHPLRQESARARTTPPARVSPLS